MLGVPLFLTKVVASEKGDSKKEIIGKDTIVFLHGISVDKKSHHRWT
jgi:hypothetical protein